jgi:protein kinase
MKRYEEIEVLGNGGFGTVTKSRDRQSGDIVAVKKMKQRYASFDECLQLKEVKSLRKIKHPNVVRLLQVFREDESLHLVFELLGKSLYRSISERGPHPEDEVRLIMQQILTGVAYIHRQGFFHRDLKPDNLLWKEDVLKIADFGLAREIRSRPPFTEYCGTRYYRAPEIMLRSEFYNSPVDIWSAGTIMAELFLGRPLFQGTTETDQIYKIFGVLGPPTQKNWPDGIKLANRMGIRFNASVPIGLAAVVPHASAEALGLMNEMMRLDPARRPSASQALRHEWFTGSEVVGREVGQPSAEHPKQESSLDEILGALLVPEENVPNRASALAIDRDGKPGVILM